MATEAISMLMEEPQVSSALPQSQPQPICPDVLGSIYADHYQYVLRVCRRFFRQPEDAEDAAAEVFLKLYRVLHQRDESMPFRPWVSQVAGRHCIDKLRQRKCERSSSLEDIDISGFADHSALSPLSEILRKDEQRQIREHLTRLPEKYKVPLVLLYYKRMSYSEIAGTLNTRLPAIRMIIFRAKDFLRRNLRREQSAEN
ncbi:MAG: sigma-70 family RNA polymerase sigma factor [Candidatus Acidiferrum sp.]|jgi:RNA polymerase sigma-70 factor, ECF subfamily|nr:sigma-70 family RNA polymerase sigma factor [Candidatus Acidoferrum sp.]